MLFRAWKNQECPNCHTRPSDWENDRDYRVADTVHCEGCARIEELQDQMGKSTRRAGTYIGLFPKDVVEARLELEDE